jgi:acetyl esterase/lipase
MFTRLACLALVVMTLALAACGGTTAVQLAQPTAIPTSVPVTVTGGRFAVQTRTNVAYGPLPLETLDVCTPVASGAHPGVVMIHGGGWAAGDKAQYDDGCKVLAAQGIVAATLNYRLAPAAVWPAQLMDVQLAVRWLRANAPQLGLDVSRLCSWGDSAGGHLAVFLGVATQIHAGDLAARLSDQSPAVTTCVVDAYGPVDLTGTLATAVESQILQTFIGATAQQNPAAYRDASPLLLVSDRTPPMLIIQGTADTLVPPSQSLALQTSLQAHHIAVQYISYDGGHALSGLTKDQINAILTQIAVYLIAQLKP